MPLQWSDLHPVIFLKSSQTVPSRSLKSPNDSLATGKCSRLQGSVPSLHLWLLPPPITWRSSCVQAPGSSLTSPLLHASELGRGASSPCPLGLLFWLLAGSSWAPRAWCLSLDDSIYCTLFEGQGRVFSSPAFSWAQHRGRDDQSGCQVFICTYTTLHSGC